MAFEEPSRWCTAFFALVLASVLGMIGVAWIIDFYDNFHPARHAAVQLYSNQRMGKYLLSFQYIPREFNGLLIGSSVTQNWPLTEVGTTRIYNASLSGANISEEKLLAENVLARGHVTLVVFCIHPYLTMTHGLRSSYMTPQDYWAAFGSLPLYREYAGALLTRIGRGHVLVDATGVMDSAFPDPGAEAIRERRTAAPHSEESQSEIAIDEKALSDYAGLLKASRAHGARIVGFVPPISAAVYAERRDALRSYFARIAGLFAAGETIIDFNAPQYAAYTGNRSTFVADGTHLTEQAAAVFARALANAIEQQGAADPRMGTTASTSPDASVKSQ